MVYYGSTSASRSELEKRMDWPCLGGMQLRIGSDLSGPIEFTKTLLFYLNN